MKLLKVRRRRGKIWFLGLEGFSDFGHSSQNSVPRVQETLLQT